MEVMEIEKELEEKSLSLLERSQAVRVFNEESYGFAGTLVKEAKVILKERTAYFAPMKEAAAAAHKAICAKEKEALAPINGMIATVTAAQNEWLAAEDRRKRAEQARLEAEAREAARKEQERLQRAAEKAEAQGKTEKAEELIEQAAEVVPEPVYAAPVVPAPVRTGDTTSFTVTETEITVVDLKAFVKAIADNGYAPSMLEIKVAPLKAFVKAMGLKTFPGLAIREVPKARNR